MLEMMDQLSLYSLVIRYYFNPFLNIFNKVWSAKRHCKRCTMAAAATIAVAMVTTMMICYVVRSATSATRDQVAVYTWARVTGVIVTVMPTSADKSTDSVL